jgi:outer membrane receptor for ferrienterochelin and colicins
MVAGMNLELNLSIGGSLIFQSGGTFQSARYRLEEEIWSAEEENSLLPPARTRRLLRTPDAYGYFSMVYNPVKKLSLSWSGVLTGPMLVPHVINAGNGQTVLKNTPGFLENNFRIAFKFRTKENLKLELFGGVQNMFNRFQRDFDRGMLRDAGYVYGPSRPRTLFIGMKAGMN